MKIKFNWGTGILIVIILFFGSMALRIYISYQQELNLVSEDYYPKEIRYQEQIDKENNTNRLNEKPTIKTSNDSLIINFPEFFRSLSNVGNVHIYRPSDYKQDKIFKLILDPNMCQYIDISKLNHGKYIIKVEWVSDNIEYFLEKEIFVFGKSN